MNQAPYTVSLPEWEGPLDLLLHVIRTHELDILDIPIAFVTEQYLKYLDVMQTLNLDVAAEYLEMAATLAYIKSRMMLPEPPRQEDEEPVEEIDPREELVRRLLEYQRYKEAASQLGERPLLGRDTFPSGFEASPEEGEEQLVELGVFDLLEAFREILDRTKAEITHDITPERMSVSERIGELSDVLHPGEMVPFERLFEGRASRFMIVVTFLALLEMTRLRMTRLFQANRGGQIYVALSETRSLEEAVAMSPAARGREGARWQMGRGQRGRRSPRTLRLLRPLRSRHKANKATVVRRMKTRTRRSSRLRGFR
jgi:segregation and condensation protein A